MGLITEESEFDPMQGRDFSLLCSDQTQYGDYPADYAVDTPGKRRPEYEACYPVKLLWCLSMPINVIR
jgi:hypothetical protein